MIKSISKLLVLSSIVCLTACGGKNTQNNVATLSNADKKVESIAKEIAARAYKNGAYTELSITGRSEENVVMVYNKNKECYMETAENVPVYYDNKGNVRVFANGFEDSKDLSPMMMIEAFANGIESGKVSILSDKEIIVKDEFNKLLRDIRASMSDSIYKSNKTPEQMAADELGYYLPDIDNAKYRAIVLEEDGIDNIKSVYSSVIGEKAAKKLVADLDDKKARVKMNLTLYYTEDNSRDGATLEIEPGGILWSWDGYSKLKGDWKGPGEDFIDSKLSKEEIETRMKAVQTEIVNEINEYNK